MNAVYNAVMDKVNSSWSWGRDLMQNLINGITYMLGSLINTVADVARSIWEYLHFSVPEKGALTDVEEWMPDFMKGLAKGINKSKKYVEAAVSGVADAMTLTMQSGMNVDMDGISGAMMNGGSGGVVNNYYNNDNSRTVNQTNNSPKSLSRLEIYRQTRSVEKRTEFGRLMEDCRAGKIDRVITKSISRFARNTKDCLQYIRELKGLGITVYFEKENIDTARLSDEMMITVMGGLAQEESQSISNNVRWTFQRAMASGTLRHARIPYGYLKDDKTGNLVIDPEKAMIVRRIFDMYIGGMGIKRIAVQLNEEGIPSPTGIQWNNITINKMLRQEKYIGDTLWQKTYSEFMGKKYQTNYGQQTKYYLRDTHPAIISREDFAKVAEIKKKQAAPKGELIVSPFRKKLICGKCGHSYSSSNYLNNLSWHCGFRNNVPAPCDNITVRDRTLHFAFRAMCDKLHTHGAKIFGTCIHELKRLHKAQDNNTDEATQVRKEIAELKDKKHRLSKLLTKHFIEPEQYSAQVYEIDAQIRMLNRKLEKSPEKKDPITLRLEELAEIFENYDGSEKAQAVVMETAVQKIMVCEDGTIHFQLLDGLEFVERIETYEGH